VYLTPSFDLIKSITSRSDPVIDGRGPIFTSVKGPELLFPSCEMGKDELEGVGVPIGEKDVC
jgi:hypothetical protein